MSETPKSVNAHMRGIGDELENFVAENFVTLCTANVKLLVDTKLRTKS